MTEPTGAARRTWRGWTSGEGAIVVAGALLILDLVLLPWHHYALDVDVGNLGIDLPSFAHDRTGVQSPYPGFGIAAGIGAAVMVLQVLATKASASVPKLVGAHLVVGATVLGLLLAKLLANGSFLGAGAWLGLLLGAGLALGGYRRSQESSGVSSPVSPA